ncbi:MAG: AI-2E family transporter [Bacteroidales bacterium]|nr:AI-2E family transporter [Bacteroidales bacterium]
MPSLPYLCCPKHSYSLVFSIIFAIVLHPVVNFLVRKRFNRILTITLTIIMMFIVIAAISVLLISQISKFSESWPALVEKFTALLNNTITWASGYFDINPKRSMRGLIIQGMIYLKQGALIGKTIISLGSGLVVIFLMPVYIFLLLYYHPLLLKFLHMVFADGNQSKLTEIISQIKTVIQRYLVGLVIEAALIAAMEITALLLLGIEYALLLGVLGALLNAIPYIGGLVAVALPMMVALATKSSAWYALYVLGIYYFIQLVDNNYIVPKIVASKVKINALFSIIVVIVGNALWGVPGMFLSIPMLAIVKLIFDHIDELKPWGYLLGDTMPPMLKVKPIRLPRIKLTPKKK